MDSGIDCPCILTMFEPERIPFQIPAAKGGLTTGRLHPCKLVILPAIMRVLQENRIAMRLIKTTDKTEYEGQRKQRHGGATKGVSYKQ